MSDYNREGGEGKSNKFRQSKGTDWLDFFIFIYLSQYFNDILHGLKGKAETRTK